MKISLFDYNLPKQLIAQQQRKPRDHSRLLILDRAKQKITHKHFYDLPDYLTANDVLVVNETKVFPARLYGHKNTRGKVEILLIEKQSRGHWLVMIGGRNIKVGDVIYFARSTTLRAGQNLEAKVISNIDGKTKQIKFNIVGKKLENIIEDIGHTPLPPYIKTQDSKNIKKDYQTIYAKTSGSVAAPTAGLHFTKQILDTLTKKKVRIFKVTLHVGLGTFAPVEVEDISQHQIHH